MSGSRIIIDKDDLLDNIHPGEILRDDFLIGTEVALEEVSSGTGIDVRNLSAILSAQQDIDANIDLRLGRYFGMSEGFFLRLQNSFDLEEQRRAHGDALNQITKRAA